MRSMTGYGAAEGKVGKGKVFVEIRTVNHRYCDLLIKIPPKMGVLDPKIRKLLQGCIDRGKVDFFLKERIGIEPNARLVINEPLVQQYQQVLRKLSRLVGQKVPSDLLSVVEIKDLLLVQEGEVSYEALWTKVKPVVDQAVSRLNKMRDTEGRFLHQDQVKRVARIALLVKQIQKLANQDEVNLHNDESPMADRVDVAEEITRLQSHLSQYRGVLNAKGAIGRQLDFLLQEMNREINTIGSKALNVAISKSVIEAKSELEKLREQAQNIE
jgi:uncharacterized protein YicC (UPF0701 family)